MASHLRKMKPYHPRRRGKNNAVHKQALRDLERKIRAEISTLILFWEEGNEQEIQAAQLKAKSGYLKYCNEMEKIACLMGERYWKAVKNFLSGVDALIHCQSHWIDEAKVRNCYTMAEQLEKELSAA